VAVGVVHHESVSRAGLGHELPARPFYGRQAEFSLYHGDSPRSSLCLCAVARIKEHPSKVVRRHFGGRATRFGAGGSGIFTHLVKINAIFMAK
jgi:hypothetical protein